MEKESALTRERPADRNLDALLEVLRHRGTEQVEPARQIYCNRDINFHHIEAIGFDMDYTLAVYKQEAMDRLSVELTVERLIEHRGYSEELRKIEPRPDFAIRGLVVDRYRGNILKLDSHRHVGKAYHGFTELAPEELQAYRAEPLRFAGDRYALIDTLYALPEAFLYAALIDMLEAKQPGVELDFQKVFDDIRFSIDLAHRDGSFKKAIMKDTAAYIKPTPYLALTLHRLRSAGKKLFLLTNSYPAYTEHLMSYLLDDALEEYDSWRDYFDVSIAAAHKPRFFTEHTPFYKVDDATMEPGDEVAGSFQRGVIYQHGNLQDFITLSGLSADRTLYVGDHIYGDILRSRKSSAWRTVMIVQEMERELQKRRELQKDMDRINTLEEEIARLTQEISQDQWLSHNVESLVHMFERTSGLDEESQAEDEVLTRKLQSELKHSRDRMRRQRKELLTQLHEAEFALQSHFNPWWGLIFKMNNKNSLFGEQVEDYACLYTSQVSNFINYSPMHYFRAPRQPMPHELI
jgi:HAD superfamily 5'-nucleotidase-like hydrolase